MKQLPLFQSHRGYFRSGAKENSLESFRASFDIGYQMIECDVQLSRDNVPVIYHDETLQRLDQNIQRIDQLDFNCLKSSFQIPSLEDLLLSKYRPKYINIELKTSGWRSLKLADEVVKIVKKTKQEGNIIFSSFNPFILAYLHYTIPSVPRAFLLESFKSKTSFFVNLIDFQYLNLNYKEITQEILIKFKNKKIPVVAWTVNDAALANELIQMGVKSIITDQILPRHE